MLRPEDPSMPARWAPLAISRDDQKPLNRFSGSFLAGFDDGLG
jgi:hypothetical protein